IAYGVLNGLTVSGIPTGSLFCEWGSGFGVVACLAAFLEFDASGIEIEGELVDAARQLADDFDLPVEFIHGSFIPKGAAIDVNHGDAFNWLTTEEANAFFFQAEDGIRDLTVTGVQTCALPI